MGSAIVGTLRVILTADSVQFDAAMKRAASSAQAWSKDLKSIGQQATQLGSALTRTLTIPLLGLGVGAAKLAMDFESSFAGVRKTVKATEPEFAALAQGLRDMAKEIPVNVNELNKVAEAAGQLGVKKEDILQFTRTMADLGVATNLTADEAATATAQIQNIFGAAGKDVDRFGAALVALGNDGASTEKSIIDMSLRIAGSGHLVGLSQAQVLAFANALSSVGINAEAGGSAISRTFLKINDAVSEGGESLAGFARVAGMSAELFKKAFQEDAATATVAFIEGLKRLKDSGENVNQTLVDLVGKNIIIKDTLLRASGAGDLLRHSLELGNKAWQENTALVNEARERYKTTESQLTILWNRVKDVGITLGNALLPSINLTISALTNLIPVIDALAKGFGALPTWVQATAIGFGLAVAAAGPLLWVFGQLATSAGLLIAQFTTKGLVMRGLTALFPTLTAATTAQAVANTAAGTTATAAAGGLSAMRVAAIGLAQALGAVAVVAGSAVLAYRAISHASDLAKENAERASMAANEQARRYAMIAEAGRIAGHSIHDYATAVLIVTEHSRKLHDEILRGGAAYAEAAGPPAHLASALGVAGRAASGLSAELVAVQKVMAAFTAEQRANIVAGDKLGESNENIAKSLGLTGVSLARAEAAVKLYLDSFKGAKQVAKDVRELAEAINKLSGKALVDAGRDLEKQLKLVGGQSKVLISELPALSEGFKKAAEGARNMGDVLLAKHFEDLAKATDPANEGLRRSGIALDSVSGFAIDADASLHALWEEVNRLSGNTLTFAQQKLETFAQALERLGKIQPGFEKSLTRYTPLMPGAFPERDNLPLGDQSAIGKTIGQQIMGGIGESLKGLPALFTQAFTGGGGIAGAFKAIGVQIADSIVTPLIAKLSKMSQAALSIGAGTASAIGGSVGGTTGATIGAVAASLGGAALAASAWGASMAAAGVAGAVALSAATLGIGAAAIGVYLLARRWFGVSKDIKEARKQVEDFQAKLADVLTPQQKAEAGGERWKETVIAVGAAYRGTGRSAAEAEAIVKQLWDTDRPDRAREAMQKIADVMKEFAENSKAAESVFDDILEAAEKAGGTIPAAMRPMLEQFIALGLLTDDQIARIRDLADETEFDWKKMQAAGERYGDWMRTEMGQAFQQARLHEGAVELINDFDRLTKGGASVGSVLFGMKEEISRLVIDSKKFGTEIPKNMQPWIKNLFDTGQLLDENSEKISDITDLKFGEEIKTEAEIAKDAWAAILAKIEELIDKITGPLQGAIDKIPREVPINFIGEFTPPDLRTQAEPVPLASGAIVRRATLALIGERGPEIVAPLASLPALAARVLGGAFRESGFSLPNPGAIQIPDFAFSGPGEAIGRIDTKESTGGSDLREFVEGIYRTMDRMLSTRDEVLLIKVRDAIAGVV